MSGRQSRAARQQERRRQTGAAAAPAGGGAASPTIPPAASAPQAPTLFPTTDRAPVVPLIEEIERLRGSRVITYFLQPGINMAMDAMDAFNKQLRRIGKREKIDLWLHSTGGQTEFPWRLIQTIRCFCDHFGVLVPELAQSAATHAALGADEIVLGPFSLLSPVDPYRQHPLLPKGIDLDNPSAPEQPFPVSVQDLKHAVDFVKREAGSDGLSGDAFARVVNALFQHVHPLAVGAIEQSYAMSKLVTRRVLSTHMDEAKDAAEIDRLTDALCDDYKSHSFPIGLIEAERLGLKVVRASDDLYTAMWALLDYYAKDISRQLQPIPSAAAPLLAGVKINGVAMWNPIGHIDSTELRYDCDQVVDVVEDGAEVRGSAWTQLQPPATQAAATTTP